jgi:Mg2+/citrate symporter
MNIGIVIVIAAVVVFVLAALIGPREKARLEKVSDPY